MFRPCILTEEGDTWYLMNSYIGKNVATITSPGVGFNSY